MARASFRQFVGHLAEMPKVPDVITAANWREHVELECSEAALALLQSRDRPVLLVTGVTGETGLEFDAATAEERRWVPADAVLPKPIRYEQLKAEIDRLRQEHTRRPAPPPADQLPGLVTQNPPPPRLQKVAVPAEPGRRGPRIARDDI